MRKTSLLMGVAVAVVCSAVAGPRTGASASLIPEVAELQQKLVAFAGGHGALQKVRTLAFDFRVSTGESGGPLFHHAYDRDRGLYRYECTCADFAKVPVWDETAGDRWQPAPDPPRGDRLVAIYHFPSLDGTVYVDGRPLQEPDNTRILRRVHSRVMNERAWMFLPFFLSSPRLEARRVDSIADPARGALHGFEGFWGKQPGDSDVWTAYVGPDGELVRSDFRLKHSLEKSTTVLWRDWQWYGPVRIARERLMPANGRRLLFEGIRVNSDVTITESPGR